MSKWHTKAIRVSRGGSFDYSGFHERVSRRCSGPEGLAGICFDGFRSVRKGVDDVRNRSLLDASYSAERERADEGARSGIGQAFGCGRNCL